MKTADSTAGLTAASMAASSVGKTGAPTAGRMECWRAACSALWTADWMGSKRAASKAGLMAARKVE